MQLKGLNAPGTKGPNSGGLRVYLSLSLSAATALRPASSSSFSSLAILRKHTHKKTSGHAQNKCRGSEQVQRLRTSAKAQNKCKGSEQVQRLAYFLGPPTLHAITGARP